VEIKKYKLKKSTGNVLLAVSCCNTAFDPDASEPAESHSVGKKLKRPTGVVPDGLLFFARPKGAHLLKNLSKRFP
jgi:hypothetical protein